MAKQRAPRILFFTANAMPTPEEQAYADRLGTNVGFRHGRIAQGMTKPEPCSGVAAIRGELIPGIFAKHQVPRVKNYNDVMKLRPMFDLGNIGYSDDDDDVTAVEDDITAIEPGDTNNEPNPNELRTDGDGSDGGGGEGGEGSDGSGATPPASNRRGRKPATPPPAAPPVTPPAPPAGEAPATPPADGTTPPAWGTPPVPGQ